MKKPLIFQWFFKSITKFKIIFKHNTRLSIFIFFLDKVKWNK